MASDSVALPVAQFERPIWATALNWTGAVLLAILFLVAGLWKVTDPTGAAVRLAQAKVPESLSLLGAVLLGTTETFTGVLLLVPKYRRWGAWLGIALLLFFMVYIGYYYNDLRGQECSCFPWVKRAVGPAFFIGDGVMLLLGLAAGLWSRKTENLKGAALILAAVCVFSAVSFGVDAAHHSGTPAPATILVNQKPYSLRSGKVFLYFFDPSCLHCLEAGRKMATLKWGDTKFIGVPVTTPEFASFFMQKSGLNQPVSSDWPLLNKTFSVKGTPGAVALEDGYEKAQLTRFEGDEPASTLRKLGFAY